MNSAIGVATPGACVCVYCDCVPYGISSLSVNFELCVFVGPSEGARGLRPALARGGGVRLRCASNKGVNVVEVPGASNGRRCVEAKR